MHKTRLARIAISALVVLLALAGITITVRTVRAHNRTLSLLTDCNKTEEVKVHLVPLQSMGIERSIYGFDNAGTFFRLNLPEETRTIISDHGFHANWGEMDFGVNVEHSADGRWIEYNHKLGNSDVTQYWLYDTRLGTDRLAFQASAWQPGEARLSPDGSLLAIAPEYGTRSPEADTGIYLFDTATLAQTRIALPAKLPANVFTSSLRWSADGKELLIELGISDEKHGKDEYYSWHVADKSAENIDGNGRPFEDLRFLRQGTDIPLAPDLGPQSDIWSNGQASPSGSWHARLRKPDEKNRLTLEVLGKDGTTKTVFSVPFETCEAPMLGEPAIMGWLDERHLVFSDSPPGNFYVFDTATGNLALLFEEVEDSRQFFW